MPMDVGAGVKILKEVFDWPNQALTVVVIAGAGLCEACRYASGRAYFGPVVVSDLWVVKCAWFLAAIILLVRAFEKLGGHLSKGRPQRLFESNLKRLTPQQAATIHAFQQERSYERVIESGDETYMHELLNEGILVRAPGDSHSWMNPYKFALSDLTIAAMKNARIRRAIEKCAAKYTP